MSRPDVVVAARAYIGTPYLHQGRVKGPLGGIDCVGLPVGVAWDLGLKAREWNVTGYRRLPDGVTLMRQIRPLMAHEVPQTAMAPGDLLVIAWDRFPHHVGILGDHLGGLSIIHADNRRGEVVEQRLVLAAGMKFVAAFRFPEVAHV